MGGYTALIKRAILSNTKSLDNTILLGGAGIKEKEYRRNIGNNFVNL